MERMAWRGRLDQQLVVRAERLLDSGERSVLGLAGAPASGKSTLARELLLTLSLRRPGLVAAVGMDAFHIGHRVLRRYDQVKSKGAPDTFDVYGYVALLERLRSADHTVYAPEFDRRIEDSLAAVVEVPPAVRLVITEGNYLLLPQSPWNLIRDLLDEAWFIHLDDEERQRRMVKRHLRYGHSHEDAVRRTYGSDEDNARLVEAGQNSPDLWIEHLVPANPTR